MAELSAAQRGLWALDQLAPSSAFYNVAVAYRLHGPVDAGALEGALAAVVARHEVLRTSIESAGGVPVARVRGPEELSVAFEDLSGVAEGRRDAEAHRAAAVEAARPFDLAGELPFRARLVRLAPDDHVLSVTAHQVAADEPSLCTVLEEVSAAYSSGASSLPPVALQYAELARREAASLRGEDLDVLLAFWRKLLRDAPAGMRLPFDHARKSVPEFKGAAVDAPVDATVAAQLEEIAATHGAPVDDVLLAAFAALLHRYTGDDDLVIGWPVDARIEETRSVVGTFVNVLPLRLRVHGNETFAELLARVSEVVEAVREHRDLPLETLVEELRPRRGPGHAPLFQVAVAVGDDPPEVFDLPGVEASAIRLEPATAQLDLFLDVKRSAAGLKARLELATDVFDPATIHALARHWTNLLRGICADPVGRVRSFPLLDAEERAALSRFSDGGRPREVAELVPDAVVRRAGERPDALAVAAPDGDVTYGELEARSAAVAASLARHGIARGSVVALLVERSAAMVPAMLGVLRAGCAYIPLDPAYPIERLTLMLEDSGAAALIGDAGPPGLRLPAHVARVEVSDGEAPDVEVSPRDAAYVVYTSGSTGRPKGVAVEHAALAQFVTTITDELELNESDRVLQFSSLSFDTAVEEIWPALVAGAALVLRDPHPWHPEELRDKVAEHGITVLDLPTAYWHEVAAAAADGVDVRESDSLRLVVVGGEAMSAEATRAWHASSPRDRSVRLLNTYGPTETTVTATSFDATSWREAEPVPIGRPLPGVRAYVLDEDLEPAPAGVAGELYVGGSGVARGYLGRPSTTAERFVPDPWAPPGARMYATGDLVRRRRDGVLSFVGRRDHQVKIRGFRIEPGEVEAVLAAHPGVADSAVVTLTGQVPCLAAYFVAAAPGSANGDTVKGWLREHLPEHMVPAVVEELDALPKTPGGKVDRAGLAARAPEAGPRAVTPPRTPAEQVLASMWQKLLGVEEAGIDESFFDLGGHSLVATQLVSRIRHAFGVSLPLRTVFEWPTIAGLAAVVERSAGADDVDELPLAPVERDAPLPLSFAQQRLWFIDQFKPGSADYVIAARAELEGPLDVAALRDALTVIARRHEALRTTFPSQGGEAHQAIAADPAIVFETFDLSGEPSETRAEAAARLVQTEASRPFDLAAGPLWRTALIRLDEDRHLFVTCMHHIVSDGWSLGIFAVELSELYSARVEGREPGLPELEVAYADFAVWQRRWFTGDELDRQLAYWKERLHGAPAVLELPSDRPRPPIQSFEGATVGLTLPRQLSDSIARLARSHEVTTFMVTLAALQVLLHRYTGATDVVVGSPIAGRNRSEIEGLIGFFVNTLVLRTDLSGEPTFAELLERVREVALGAYAHQDLPFEKLVEELGIDRDLAHSPAVQVMFVFQNTPPGDLALAGTRPARLEAPTNEVAVDVTLDLTETDAGLVAQAVYNADLFDRRTIEALLRHYANVLAAVVDDPDTPLSRVELLDPDERATILTGFNPPPTPYPDDVRIHEVFERVARERAGAPAVAYGGESLSYGELNARADRLARHLAAHGAGRGDLVAVVLERGVDLVVSLLAILKAGAAYLPIDPDNPQRRTAFMLEDAGARIAITGGAVSPDGLDAALVISLERDADAIAAHDAADRAVTGDAGDVAYAIYTSGSTGTPKGICIPHRAVARLVLDTDYVKLGPHSVVAQLANASFDAATFEIWGALLNGGLVAGIEKDVALDARRLRAALEGHGVDTAFVTTALFNQLVAEDPSLFSSLDSLLVGGEALDPSMVRRCLASDAPARLSNVYGPTECTTFSTCHVIESVPEGATSIPIGRPIANTKAHVLDAALNPVPVGVPGEIHVGGPGLAIGYLDRPELTKERFVPDPFSNDDGDRLYKTGDLGRYLPSGEIEFLARMDSQVKIRGFRVELGEVEAALAEHPAVRESVVTVAEAARDKRLVAYIAGDGIAVGELRRFVAERVPFYMVPSDYVQLDALPLNANGKVDRRALPAPDPSQRAASEEHVAPRNTTEERLAAIWETLLARDGIGIHDGFFELGGHSLLATQMVSRIRDAFGVELELRAVFEAPTIARLAPVVETAPPVDTTAVPELKALPRR